MKTPVLRSFLLILLVITCAVYPASAGYLDALIAREKAQTEFADVSAMWQVTGNAANLGVDGKMLELDKNLLHALMRSWQRAISFTVGGYTIQLARFDIVSNGFGVNEIVNGIPAPYQYQPGLYYRGIVTGHPGSLVAFSFFEDEVYGMFSIPGIGNFVLAQLKGPTHQPYILYNDRTRQHIPTKGCSTGILPAIPVSVQNKNAFTSCKDIEFYIKADFQTYTDNGSSTTAVLNYLSAAFNAVATLYRNDGVYISLKHIDVNTTFDVYQSTMADAVSFILAFGNETQNNLHGADLAMLVSTIGGGMGGVGWPATICKPYDATLGSGPYSFCNLQLNMQGLPAYSNDIHLMAHEPAHNIGVKHTHNCNWPGGAIDGCATLEGSCSMPSPQFPAGGGTIMSYCHLQSGVGVDFTKGFGQYVADTLRTAVSGAACAEYVVNTPLTAVNANLVANRECTDGNGVTYYMNDGSNDDETDDRLLLKIEKNGAGIGTVDDAGFEARVITLPNYSSGNGTNLLFPPGMQNVKTFHSAINRYWKVIPITQPSSLVKVIFPFTRTDLTDADGSVNGNSPLVLSDLSLYQAKQPLDPNPLTGFASVAQNDIIIYTTGVSPSPVQWMASVTADTFFAHFLTNSLNGGTAFYTYFPVGVENVQGESSVVAYPNPAKDAWYIILPSSAETSTIELYAADGRLVHRQPAPGGINRIDAHNYTSGAYYYRIRSNTTTYTGCLMKQ